MKLKDIYKENLQKNGKKALKNILFQFDTSSQTLLYRGTDTEIKGNWKMQNIQQKRTARATSYIQPLLDWYVDYKNLEVPKRRKSKYATTKKKNC